MTDDHPTLLDRRSPTGTSSTAARRGPPAAPRHPALARPRFRRYRLSHIAEGLGATLLFVIFRLLPLDWASGLGGFIGRHLGPRLRVTRRALKNLRRALPELDDATARRVIVGMWDNLGRVVAEYPHLDKFRVYGGDGRVVVENPEFIGPLARERGSVIFFSGHFGNWEVATLSVTQAGIDVAEIYRAANNPIVDRLISDARCTIGSELIPKGSVAARRALVALREGRSLAMLVDQKMNDGIAVPFFGRAAMTAPAMARLALRAGCPVVPVRVERLGGARFRITASPPVSFTPTGDPQADTFHMMRRVNEMFERWIRERPEQWFWLHRRWPD